MLHEGGSDITSPRPLLQNSQRINCRFMPNAHQNANQRAKQKAETAPYTADYYGTPRIISVENLETKVDPDEPAKPDDWGEFEIPTRESIEQKLLAERKQALMAKFSLENNK